MVQEDVMKYLTLVFLLAVAVLLAGCAHPLEEIVDANHQARIDAANARHRWEFLLTLAPLAVQGGTGSPINPIAIF